MTFLYHRYQNFKASIIFTLFKAVLLLDLRKKAQINAIRA
jgi:hypothetical protein